MIKGLITKLLEIKVVRFLLVGGTAVAIDFGFYSLIVFMLSLPNSRESILANMISKPISFLFNFTISRSWTFKAKSGNQKHQMIKFLTVVVVNYIFSTILLGITVSLLNLVIPNLIDYNQLIAFVIITGIFALINFLLYELWVFKT
jgi:putative flippase GtrA